MRLLKPTALSLLALALTLAASLWLALGPVYHGLSVTPVPVGPGTPAPRESPLREATPFSASLIAVNGVRVVPLLALPVALTLLGLSAVRALDRSHTLGRVTLWGLALVLLAFCAVGIFSIGLFYLPSALLLLGAALSSKRRQPQ